MERYTAAESDAGGISCVLDHERIARVIAECGTFKDALMIARALSQHAGAVEAALSDLMGEALKQHPEPTPDELATIIGYLVLRRVGGQA
jgi:hypothetical protein